MEYKNITENQPVHIDFSKTAGEMVPKVGFLLVPNEDVPDGRILPLHVRIVRDGFDAQNYLGTHTGNNSPENTRDYLINEHNQLERMKDSVERLDELGIQYYPILVYNQSWNSTTGLAQGKPKDLDVHKELMKDIFQYIKDNHVNIREFDVWNEDWGGVGDLYPQLHKNAWEAMMDILPDGALIGPPLADSPDPLERGLQLIEDCAKWEIPVGVIAWHFVPEVRRFMDTWESKAKEHPVVGPVRYYYEEYSWPQQSGVKNFKVMEEFDRAGVDEAIRGIWRYPNGLSDMVRTDQTKENPNYRLCEWWHTAAYGSMSGQKVKNDSPELYIASIDTEKGEAKVLIGSETDRTVSLFLENLPFEGKITADRYQIARSVNPEADIAERVNDLPENEGIQYRETAELDGRSPFTLDMHADEISLLVVKTEKSIPSDFYLKSPDDHTLVLPHPTLCWQKSQGAEAYDLEIAFDKQFRQVVSRKTGLASETYTVKAELEKDRPYYWRVTAVNENGRRAPLNNMYYAFTVTDDVEVPGGFVMLQVPNGADSVSTNPRFTWTQSRNADSFLLEISETEDFENARRISVLHPEKRVTSWNTNTYLEYTLAEPLRPASWYYARISAVNEHGIRRMNNKPHKFRTTSPDWAPMDFDLLYPANGAVIEQRETLRWEKTPGSFFYELEVASDRDFSNVLIRRRFLTQPAYTLESNLLEPDTVYYWRVTAASKDKMQKTENRAGVQSFRTSPVPAAPTFKSFIPEKGGAAVIFEPVLGADSYTVKIGTAPGAYDREITGIASDRVFVPLAQESFCAVTACRNGLESKIHNERLVKPAKNEME